MSTVGLVRYSTHTSREVEEREYVPLRKRNIIRDSIYQQPRVREPFIIAATRKRHSDINKKEDLGAESTRSRIRSSGEFGVKLLPATGSDNLQQSLNDPKSCFFDSEQIAH